MDAISFDPNLIDCYLNGEGDYDFLISMLGSEMTTQEFDVLSERIGAALDNCLDNADSLPEELLARTLQIIHATQDVKLKFTWEQCQNIMMPYLSLCTAIGTSHNLKMVYLTLNQLLQDATFLHVIITDRMLLPAIAEVSKQLFLAGDYESQAVIFETMIRISHSDRKYWARIWFTGDLIDMFVDIDGGSFERTCRYFLNTLNNTMMEQRVFSYVAQSVFIDDLEMKRPPDYEFWVDFNYNSASISFYCVDHESVEEVSDENTSTTMWETVNLTSGLIMSCHLKTMPNSGLQEIITYLKRPYFENKSDSMPIKGQENKPFIKIWFDGCYEIESHLQDIFKSLYKGQPNAVGNGFSNYTLDDVSNEDVEESQHMIQNIVTHVTDSDDELHIDEQYQTSTPISCAEQINFHDIPSQLTPLTTMVPLQTRTHNTPDYYSSQNTHNDQDPLTRPHVISDLHVDLTFEQDCQTVANAVSPSFNYAELQTSIKQEKSDSFDDSLYGNKSTEAMILQMHIKEEITSSSELEIANPSNSGIKTTDKIKEVSKHSESLSPKVMSFAEMSKENEESEAVAPEALTTGNPVPKITQRENNISGPKKSSSLKGKIRRGKVSPKFSIGKSSDTNVAISNLAKRKPAVIYDKATLQEGTRQNEDVRNAERSIEMPVADNLSSISLKTTSGNKKADSKNKVKTTSKTNVTTKSSTKKQEVYLNGNLDSSPIQVENISDSEISCIKETIEPKDKTVSRDFPLKGLARNVTTKSALRRKSQGNGNATPSPLSVTRSSVSFDGKNKVDSVLSLNVSPTAKSTEPLHKRKQNNHSPYSHVLALVRSRETEPWMEQDEPHPLDESAIASHETTDRTKKSTPKPLVKSDPPLLESDPFSFATENCSDDTSLNSLHVSLSTVPSTDKKPSNKGETNLNQEKTSKQVRFRHSLYNSDLQKRVDFSPTEMKEVIGQNTDIDKDAKFNAKESKNLPAKKKRQPRARAKKLPLKGQGSSNDVNLPSSDIMQSEQVLEVGEFSSNDYELYVTPRDVSKPEVSTIAAKEKSVTEDSGFLAPTTDEKSTLMETTPEGPELQSKKRKLSTDDEDMQLDLIAAKKGNISVESGQKKFSDDNDSDFDEPMPSKKCRVKKTNRKAAVSSREKTKKILRSVKTIAETDSSSVVELQPAEPSTNEVCKTSNERVKVNVNSGSDVSWMKGKSRPSFEVPKKTYKIWTRKNLRVNKTQASMKTEKNVKASAEMENKDAYHWSNIDNFNLTFDKGKNKKPNLSLEKFEETGSVVTKSKSKRNSSTKSVPGPLNSRKSKKASKPSSSFTNHYKDRKIASKVTESDGNNLTGDDSSYLPHVLLDQNDLTPIKETVVINAQDTYPEEDISPFSPIKKTPIDLSKVTARSKIATKKRISKSIQKKQKPTVIAEIDQEIPQNPLPELPFPSMLSNRHSVDSDNASTTHTLFSGHNSNSSCAGSDKKKESMPNHDMDEIISNCFKKPEKHVRSSFISSVPDGRKILLKRFLTDVSSSSSASRPKKKKHHAIHSGRKTSLAPKKNYHPTGQNNKFKLMDRNSMSETSDCCIKDGHSSSKHLQNSSHFPDSSASSDSNLSLTFDNMLPLSYDDDQKLLKHFMYAAQMLTNNLYKATISIREDYLKVLNNFDGKSSLMSGNFSSIKEYQCLKTRYWQQMRNRLKQLSNALDLYRSKVKRFEEALRQLKKRAGVTYVKTRYQAEREALHNYEKQLLNDLKKLIMKTSKKHNLFSHF